MDYQIKLKNGAFAKAVFTEKILNLFIYFLTYSFVGWTIETVYMSIYHGHLMKRGFLIGPLCVVYGISSVLVIFILERLKAHPFLLFMGASLLTTAVELIAGVIVYRIINKRLWDYSHYLFNFMGFICLRNTIIWGVLSMFLLYILHPFITRCLMYISLRAKELMCFSAFIWLSLDISISVYTSLKGVSNLVWISQLLIRNIP